MFDPDPPSEKYFQALSPYRGVNKMVPYRLLCLKIDPQLVNHLGRL